MRVDELLQAIADESKAAGISPDLAKRIFGAENFKDGKIPEAADVRTDLVSPKGAQGVFQIMPQTHASLERMGLVPKGLDPKNPLHSVKLGVATLKESLGRTGSEAATIAEYNGGSAARKAVQNGEQPPAEETRRYLQNTGVSAMTPQQIEQQASAQPRNVRTSTTTRGDEGDVASLMSQLEAYSSQQKELSAGFSSVIAGAAAHQKDAAAAAKTAGAYTADAIETKGAIDVARAEQQQQILQIFGVSVDDPNGQVAARKQMIANARVAQADLRPQIEAKESVSLLADPVQWIMNQFELPKMKAQFNSARRAELVTLEQDAVDRKRAQDQIALDAPNTVRSIQLLASQQAAATRAQAAFEAAQAETKSQTLLASSLQEQMANNRTDFNTRSQLALKFMDTVTMTDGAAKMDKEFRADSDLVNFKLQSLGLPMYGTKSAWMDLGAQQRSELRRWAQLPGYGTGPGDTMLTITSLGGGQGFAQAAPGAAMKIKEWRGSQELEKLRADRFGPTADAKLRSLPQLNQDAMLLDELATKWQKEVVPARDGKMPTKGHNFLSPGNPYRLNSTYALSAAELKDNLVNQMARDQFRVDSNQPMTDVQIAEGVKRMMFADPTKVKLLSQQMAQYFQVAVKKQYESQQLALMGFQEAPGYVLSGVDKNSTEPRALQVTSPAEIERWLMSENNAHVRAMSLKSERVETMGSGALRGLR